MCFYFLQSVSTILQLIVASYGEAQDLGSSHIHSPATWGGAYDERKGRLHRSLVVAHLFRNSRQKRKTCPILGNPGAVSRGGTKLNRAKIGGATNVFKSRKMPLKTFVGPPIFARFSFVPPRLTAPGSPRMNMPRTMVKIFPLLWSCGGLVVSALDFRSGGRWFEPGLCRRAVSLDKRLYSKLSLFTQVHKWVSAIIMLGVALQ